MQLHKNTNFTLNLNSYIILFDIFDKQKTHLYAGESKLKNMFESEV